MKCRTRVLPDAVPREGRPKLEGGAELGAASRASVGDDE